jgi:hypothetical protein
MDLYAIVQTLQTSALADWVRLTPLVIPWVNAVHVLGVALLFGTLAIVDLRLLGWASVGWRFNTVATSLLKFTWIGFVLAVGSGFLLFVSNPEVFFNNVVFRIKFVLLFLAAINMAIFELITARTASRWGGEGVAPPIQARVAGLLSLIFWVGVITAGRVVGFTKQPVLPDNTDLLELTF